MSSASFCLVTTFYPPANFGGDGVHVRRLARGLASRGHRVRVIYNPAAYGLLAPDGVEALAWPDDPGVEAVAAPFGSVGTVSTYLAGFPIGHCRSLSDLATGFDVVHFHNPSLITGPGGLASGQGLRLYTTHEHWLICPTHVLYRYGREVCARRTCLSCTLSYKRPPQLWRYTPFLRRSLRSIDALLCPSRFTADLHREFFPEAHIEVLVPPGPEPLPDTPSPAPVPPRVDPPFFLYAGRLERIKGVDRLVAAFRHVVGADLLIAGDGNEEKQLLQQAAGCPRIRFLGRLSQVEIGILARAALAVVVPSVGYETLGGVAVEAMTVGTPAVVRDLGALPEIVEAGGGVSFGTEEELIATLQRLVDDPVEAERLGREASAVAAERFGEQRFFSDYFDVISRLARAANNTSLTKRAAQAATEEEEAV